MGAIEYLDLLQQLINARGPSGQEDEVHKVCYEQLQQITNQLWVDPAGNLIGKIQGSNSSAPAIRLVVHMDEISLIVKRINEDGSLRVNPLGGILPFSFGQGPVDILGDNEWFTGILSFGCMHTSNETVTTHKIKPEASNGLGKTVTWEDVSIVTRKTAQELKAAGVHPGTRVAISQSRRKIHEFQDSIAGYFLDNRAAILVGLLALKNIKKNNKIPENDIYFVATCSEEIGGPTASYASRTLPGDMTIAIDVGPVAKEYETVLSSSPIVVFQDGVCLYDKKTCDYLLSLGNKMGLNPQSATFSSYGSDASLALLRGQSAKCALLCFPVENTHGYEITHRDSVPNCAALLEAYLLQPN